MQRRIITVPTQFFRFRTSDWDIDWREQSTGTTVAGRRNILMGQLPRWIGSPSLEFHPDRIPGWRAKRWAARGQTGLFRITMVDYIGMRAGNDNAVPFSGGTTFDDGAGFGASPFILSAAAADAGDTELLVDASMAPVLPQPGQMLSHDDWPFAVIAVDGPPEAMSLSVEMPLRRPIPGGAVILLRGRGIFEMVEPRSGNPAYDATLMSRPTFQLQEWLR
jgi:hypothetical protein